MRITESLEYIFYIALIALLIYGPPPAQEENDAITIDPMIAVTQHTAGQLYSW